MKKVFLLLLLPLCLGLMGMESCFPGDGQLDDPLGFGLPDHGPALSYTDNGDGTVTDNVTKFAWEKKTGTVDTPVDCNDPDNPTGSCTNPHDVNNRYTWSVKLPDPDGTLFTLFLEQINHTCEGEGSTPCDNDKDCAFGEKCGLAGKRDWCIPNVKRSQSIVDYAVFNPSIDPIFGPTQSGGYWSSTTNVAVSTNHAWFVDFFSGDVGTNNKVGHLFARAVRPCS